MVRMERSELTKNTGLFLSLIDHISRTYLATVVFPSSEILPGEQYNIQIIFGDDRSCASVYFSFILQKSLSWQRKFYDLFPTVHVLEVRRAQSGFANQY